MTSRTPCRVRDGVSFLEPTAKERESLQSRGVQTLSSSKGSLKRVRGAHLRGQVHKETLTRHRGGGFEPFRFSAPIPAAFSPQV
jgi:hypothetical protein